MDLMLRDSNGLPYRTSGTYQSFDPNRPEHELFNVWDEESIEIGGTPIYYYEVFIQDGTIDPLYLEDRGKIYSNHPIELRCLYEPIPSTNTLGVFGIDSPDEMIFELNFKSTIQKIGHPPKIGSRIFTPHKRENWMVIQRNAGEFKLWGELRLQLICQRFQESVTTGEGRVTQKNPDFNIS